MTMILLALASLIFLILAIKRLDWALLVIVAALPSYLLRFNIAGLPTTWLEIMIFIVCTVFVGQNYLRLANNIKINWSKGAIKYRYPFDWEMALLLLIAFVAVLVVSGTTGALGIFKAYFFEAIFFFIVFINVLGQKKDLPNVVRALAISALGISALGFYQKFVDMEFLNPVWSQQIPARITSFFPYSNAIGLYLAPIVLIILGYVHNLWKSANKYKAWEIVGMLGVAGMSVATIYFARTEGALLGILVGVVVMALLASAKSRKLAIIAGILALMVVGAVPALRSFALEKLTLSDLSGEIRKQQWRETRKMLLSSPQNFLLGVGLSNYPLAVKPFHQEGVFFDFDKDANFEQKLRASAEYRASHWQPVDIYQYPHNIFLNFWTELGLLGMLLFGWLLLKFLYYASLLYSKTGDFLALGMLASMICVLVHGLVDVPYFKNDLSVLWWLLFAMLATLKLHYERSITKNNRR